MFHFLSCTFASFLSPFLLHCFCVFSFFVFPSISSFLYSFYSLLLFSFQFVATRLRDGRYGVRIAVWARDFPLLQKSRPVLGPAQPQPPIQWVPGYSYSGMNRLGREANSSSSFSAEVKNNWSCNSAPSIRLHVFRPLLLYLLRSFCTDFPACHLLRHSFLSAHFPSKEEVSRHTITLWVLFVCLVGCVCVLSIYILEPSGRFLRNLVWAK